METIIPKEFSDKVKKEFLYKILECEDVRAATALHTYANFLNKKQLTLELLPLYIEIFKTNNRYAIDALMHGYKARHFLEFIKSPNVYLLDSFFEILEEHKRNNLYPVTLNVFCGLLKRYYRSGSAGFECYPLSIGNINSLAKFLDESRSQESVINRDILDILSFVADLDEHGNQAFEIRQIARQAGRIRSDFFDSKRSLKQSLTENTLSSVDMANLGIQPEGIFLD